MSVGRDGLENQRFARVQPRISALDDMLERAVRPETRSASHIAVADLRYDDRLAGLAVTALGLRERDLRVARRSQADGAVTVHVPAGRVGGGCQQWRIPTAA